MFKKYANLGKNDDTLDVSRLGSVQGINLSGESDEDAERQVLAVAVAEYKFSEVK